MATLEYLRSAVIQILEEIHGYNTASRQEKHIFSELISNPAIYCKKKLGSETLPLQQIQEFW